MFVWAEIPDEFKAIGSLEFCKLLIKEAKIKKGSGTPNKDKVAKITREQVRKIAELKLPDLNATNVDMAMRSIEGTARSMGIEIVD